MEIGGVDQQAARELPEGDIADEGADQLVQRLPAVEGGGEQAPQRHVHPGHLEHVPPAHRKRVGLHLVHGGAGGPRRADQGSDARPDHEAGDEVPLLQRAQYADVGQPLEAATAEYQGERTVRVHSLAPAEVTSVTYAQTRCKNRAPRAVPPAGATWCATPPSRG